MHKPTLTLLRQNKLLFLVSGQWNGVLKLKGFINIIFYKPNLYMDLIWTKYGLIMY
jgi:hypothetical protein